jgi:hypothetical protein
MACSRCENQRDSTRPASWQHDQKQRCWRSIDGVRTYDMDECEWFYALSEYTNDLDLVTGSPQSRNCLGLAKQDVISTGKRFQDHWLVVFRRRGGHDDNECERGRSCDRSLYPVLVGYIFHPMAPRASGIELKLFRPRRYSFAFLCEDHFAYAFHFKAPYTFPRVIQSILARFPLTSYFNTSTISPCHVSGGCVTPFLLETLPSSVPQDNKHFERVSRHAAVWN